MDLMSMWFNFIPWWVWVIGALIAAGITFQFWAPIWLALPLSVKVGIIFVFVVAAAYLAGRNKGDRDRRNVQRANDNAAYQHRDEVHATISKLDNIALEKRASKYYRKGE